MDQAVCVVIRMVGDEGIPGVLAISRRNNFSAWGYPGGKVDAGESTAQAAVREVEEEVGIFIQEADLVPVYSGACAGDKTFWVTTFLYIGPPIAFDVATAEEGMQIKVMHQMRLSQDDVSPFAWYNREVLASLVDYYNAE